jgi:hypothetical protein
VNVDAPSLTELILGPEKRRKVSYVRIFAWFPKFTADDQWQWLKPVWRIDIDGVEAFHTHQILPLYWHK